MCARSPRMRHETIYEEIKGQKVPKFGENFNLHIQRGQQTWSRINKKQSKSRQVTVKLLKTKDKETIWKSVRGNNP